LETVLKKAKKVKEKKHGIYDFVGTMSKKEAAQCVKLLKKQVTA